MRNADGETNHMQKMLVLCILREAYQQFKLLHPGVKMGFYKFAQLRPKESVLTGKAGIHSVCACVAYQNVTLMMAGSRLEVLSKGGV